MLKKFADRVSNFFKKKNIDNYFKEQLYKNISFLESTLNYKFLNPDIYIQSLTHRSFLELHPELKKSNERLEYLGDSILNMVVAEYLYKNYTNEGEGFLTKARSSLVNRDRLAQAASNLNLKQFILYNQKYVNDTHEGLNTILADAFESLIGAVYIDLGISKAEQFILNWLVNPFEESRDFLVDRNYKGQLLEYTHALKLEQPKYVVKKVEGPDHKKEFTIEVYVDSKLLGVGTGRSKKFAEQNASKEALNNLTNGKENLSN